MKVGVVFKKEKLKDQDAPLRLIDGFLKRGVDAGIIGGELNRGDIDIAVVLGGDGVLLHTAVKMAELGVKIIGVNYGTLGFLTEYESKETDKVVSLICDENYRIQRRSIIKVSVGEVCAYCLNEVCIQRNAMAPSIKQMIELVAEMNGSYADDFLSDGAIVCTPTGSTAYSLSAGGVIMTPDISAFMLTPLCAFSLRSRPIVYSDSVKLVLSLRRAQDKALLFADGKFLIDVSFGDKVTIEKAGFTADFIQDESSCFFGKINNKFGK